MGARRRRFPRKPDLTISYALQAGKLLQEFPDSKVTYNSGKSFSWVGEIQPKPFCEIYTVKIKYKLNIRPEVIVIKPRLRKRNGDPIPHVFPGQKLCMFRKKYFEWDSTMFIVDTIVPWTSLWLLHYEVWLSTGVWCGTKEEHPGDGKEKSPSQ